MEHLVVSPQFFFLLFIFSVSSIHFFFFFFLRPPQDRDLSSYPPELRPCAFIGHLPQFLKNRHRMPDWFTECVSSTPTNTFILRRPGGIRSVVTADPADVGHFLRFHSDSCEEYKPERWPDAETGALRPESPSKYPVFHGGPRLCTGNEMAYIQMKSIAAFVPERFEVEVVDKEVSPEKRVSITLRMHGGLPVVLRERGAR